jgi:hypothetical protein
VEGSSRTATDVWYERHGEPAPEGFQRVRVHDLTHVFGRRLRAADASFKDRQDLLGHKIVRITTHPSGPRELDRGSREGALYRVRELSRKPRGFVAASGKKRIAELFETARAEKFELPTPWFVGSLKISGYFAIQ